MKINNGFTQLLILWLLLCSIITGFLIFATNEGFELSGMKIDPLSIYGGFMIGTLLSIDGIIFQIMDSLNEWVQKRALRLYLEKIKTNTQ